MVRRVYVEKREPLRQEAAGLLSELRSLLGLTDLTGLRLINRYDVEGLDEQTFRRAVQTVFSEPQVDIAAATLPAGEYLALRILIGEAAGRNWWCVVFPPLCTAATSDVPASAMAAGFTEDEVRLITEEDRGYVLKFKAVEFWETLREKWN